jgi:ubiquinone/menaquinone biosynthesis C-methylase UbiE
MKVAKQSTPRYFRYVLPALSPFPNFDVPFIIPFRRQAIQHLELKKGDRVLDVGCGTGASFPHLVDAVGKQGEVVGVEMSPAVAEVASRRIERNRWANVKIIQGQAQEVKLDGSFDAVFMFGANEIFTAEAALDNIFTYMKEDARVVVMGARVVENGWRKILNPVFRKLTSKLMLPSTPRLNSKPWELLEERMDECQVQQYAGGFIYLIWGSVQLPQSSQASVSKR